MKTTEPNIKILIARSIGGVCVVLTTNSSWIAHDCDNISCSCDDIGIDEPQADVDGTFFLWEGTGKLMSNSTPDGYEPPEPDYTGTIRPIALEELPTLLEMAPPPEPEIVEELIEKTTEIVVCTFRSTVRRSDAEEFIEVFPEATLLDFDDTKSKSAPVGRIRVPAHRADEFMVYALNDVIIVGISNEPVPPPDNPDQKSLFQ